jgi:ankyrin repeat protein
MPRFTLCTPPTLSNLCSQAILLAVALSTVLIALSISGTSALAEFRKGAEKGSRELLTAVRNGEAAKVKRLLEAGVSPHQQSRQDAPALHTAAARGHTAIVDLLIEHGANPNEVDIHKKTPLMASAKRGQLETIQHLVTAGADVDQVAGKRRTALGAAVAARAPESVSKLLSLGARTNLHPRMESVLVFGALARGATPVLLSLLDHGVNVDAKNTRGLTLLLKAARAGDRALLKELLRRGASLSEKDAQGRNAAQLAVTGGHPALAAELFTAPEIQNTPDRIDRLTYAARHGADETVRLLLETIDDPDEPDSHGETALFAACEGGQVGVVEQLLDAGASIDGVINPEATRGLRPRWTPLMIAAAGNHLNVLRTLIERGADLEQRSATGRSARSFAAWYGNISAVLALRGAGASADTPDNAGRTPNDLWKAHAQERPEESP